MRVANEYMLRSEGKTFEVTDKELINGLFLYFLGDLNSPYDIRKGLWLEGTVGTGKTTLMHIFRELMITQRRGFRMESAGEIACTYSATGDLDTYVMNITGYSGKPIELCIDELGREQLPATYFGNKLNVMQYLLQQRYGLWQSRGLRTHVTTNIDAKDVRDKYEDFILDRCKHMFNVVTIVGKSKRQ
jgi:DNA replication protein DnaC